MGKMSMSGGEAHGKGVDGCGGRWWMEKTHRRAVRHVRRMLVGRGDVTKLY